VITIMSEAKRPVPVDGFVAQRMRAFRKEKGMSQSQLATQLGLTFQQIQKYEKAVNRIGAGRLFDVARILGVPIHMMYPEPGSALKQVGEPGAEAKRISDFALSAEGWRLCRAFLSIKNLQTRKKLIALVFELADKEALPGEIESEPEQIS
jgi:transcriptional regulator with XRE-family HTH domain